MTDLLQKAIDAVKGNSLSFCKFVSANDAGATGGHQAGLYIPKSASGLLFDSPGVKGHNKEKVVNLEWEDGSSVQCRFIYYGQGTRNEYRITKLGRHFEIDDLVIIVKVDEDNYLGFVIKDQNDANLFLEELETTREATNNLISVPDGDTFRNANFKPRSRLLLQLGDQLIKNESIALIELVKNSYDADARVVNIYMDKPDDPSGGTIIIEDDGFGMTADIVQNVWLEPGSDFKSKMIENKQTSPKFKRLPIGEKGIGRFGVHKLGNVIEMTTRAKNAQEVFVRIDWRDFNNYTYLDEVPITIQERKHPKVFKNNSTGTSITISDLRKKWERGIAREVKRAVTALASPFENNESFKPTFEVFDKPGWFEGLLKWEDIRHYALFKFKATIDKDSIVKFSYNFTPWQTMTKVHPREITEKDKIIETFNRLTFRDGKTEYPFSLSEAQIGKIVFEGYIFDLDTFILKLGVSDKKGFKDYLRSNGGIKVFRDGLRVYDYGEPENDWLDLDYRRFQQPTKSVSNNLILGAVYLDREASKDLQEKTNREGFVDNHAYQLFKNSVLHVLDLVETLRVDDKKKLKSFYGPTRATEPIMTVLGEAKTYVEENVSDPVVRKEIVKYLEKVEADYKNVTENLLKAAGAGLSMSVVVHEVEKIAFEITKVLRAEKASDRIIKLVTHLSSLIDGYSEIIRKPVENNQDMIELLDQAIFNTEYRLSAHRMEIIREYQNYQGQRKVTVARNLLIGSIMNVIDNSIYWLDRKEHKALENKQQFSKKIFVNLYENSGEIVLIIADNGTGFLIPTENITEPFVSAKPGGIGLGLHIASEVMEAQGGRISFPDYGDYEMPAEFQSGAIVAFSFKK